MGRNVAGCSRDRCCRATPRRCRSAFSSTVTSARPSLGQLVGSGETAESGSDDDDARDDEQRRKSCPETLRPQMVCCSQSIADAESMISANIAVNTGAGLVRSPGEHAVRGAPPNADGERASCPSTA